MASFNVDKLLVSKIIQEGSIKEVVDLPGYFLTDPTYRKAYEYIRNYHSDVGSVPTVRVFRTDCLDEDNRPISLVEVDEPWADIKQRVEHKYILGVLTENMGRFQDAYASGDTDEAIKILGSTLVDVHTAVPKSRQSDVTENGPVRLARYLERRNNPGTLVGIPCGFPSLDMSTQGFQKGQLITITGLPKASKSTLALRMAMSMQEAGYKVLYLTYEQTVEEQERRLDAYRAGFNDNLLNSGRLTDAQWSKLEAGIAFTATLPKLVILEDCMTVSAINAQCDIVDPDIVLIDGVYMLDDDRGETRGSPQALANIVASAKFMAMRRNICVVAVTQSTPARTKGETLNNDSIMGSRAFIQYSNLVIGIERTEDTTLRIVKIIMGRSCSPCTITALFDYDSGQFVELEGFDTIDSDTDQELEYGENDEVGFSAGF